MTALVTTTDVAVYLWFAACIIALACLVPFLRELNRKPTQPLTWTPEALERVLVALRELDEKEHETW